ncbi:MAG: type II secretion system F family protein [Nitrososphaerota archaeon]|nr:type II secretion system F family protein [Nitrososphaerota archaeon]MDG7023343.1 type II secretion system F family protein [Nitrososphaerota archaeon]
MGERVAEGTLISRLVRTRSAKFAELLRRSGKVGNPTAMATRTVRNALRSAPVAVPAALVGALFSPLFLLVAAVPLGFVVAPQVRLSDLAAQRREGVERELPFFAMIVSVLGGAGIPLYSIFRGVAKGDTFHWIGKEALMVKRDVEMLGMNANDAFERLASSHPSKKFSEFLLGYTSKARSGGDVPFYLVGESGALLRGLEESWARYTERAGIVGSMMITVFGVVPLLLMVVGVFSPGFSMFGLVVFTGLGVPVFTIGLLYMAGRMQPAREDAVQGRAGLALALALSGALVDLATGLAWAGVAAALFVFFSAYGLSVRGQIAETKALDEGVSAFLKDLLEYKRQEYDLVRAIVAIEASGKYGERFSRLLSRVAAQLKAGVPLDEVRVECRSGLGRITFLLLGEMNRTGGGTVDTVYQISNFAGRLSGMKENTGAEMKPYLILSYISPLLLAFGITFVQGILSSFSRRVAPGFSAFHVGGAQLGALPPGLTQISDLLIIVAAASLGLIGAKMTDFTVRNTLRASVNVALAVAAVTLMAAFGAPSLSHLL